MKQKSNSTKAPAKSRKSEESFRSTLDNMLEGCQIIDFDWRYVYVNNAAARHGHRTPEELLTRTMMEAYPGIENTELFSVLKQCMEERVPRLMENKFDNPDGTTGWFELSIQPAPEGLFILSIEITERKLAEQKAQEQLANVIALREIDLAILSSFELKTTLDVGLNQVMARLNVDAANVMLLDPAVNILKYAAGRGFRHQMIEFCQLNLGEGHAGRAALEQRTIHIQNLKETKGFLRAALIEGEGFISYYGVPLIVKRQVRGVLEAGLRDDTGRLVCGARPA